MPEQDYLLGEPIFWRNLFKFKERCNTVLGRAAVVSVGFDGLGGHILAIDLTNGELDTIRLVNRFRNFLDQFDPQNTRTFTLAQLENAVDSITNLADAKAFLKRLSRVVFWLMKRELAELEA